MIIEVNYFSFPQQESFGPINFFRYYADLRCLIVYLQKRIDSFKNNIIIIFKIRFLIRSKFLRYFQFKVKIKNFTLSDKKILNNLIRKELIK